MAYLAPAGTVLSLAEIGRGFARGFSGQRARESLDAEIRARAQLAYSWPIASGRAAMCLLRSLGDRRKC